FSLLSSGFKEAAKCESPRASPLLSTLLNLAHDFSLLSSGFKEAAKCESPRASPLLSTLLNLAHEIKSLLDAVEITSAHVCVNTTQLELVLLVNFNKKYTKCLLLLEVIENDATLPKTQVVEDVTTLMPITTVEEKTQRRLKVKARSTLMIGILNQHQLKFNSIKDTKQLLEAVEKRFGGNEATKKTQRNLLKQQYENFTASSSEMLDQTINSLQKLMTDLDTMSMDDLYKNLKVYEPEVKGMSSLSSSTKNVAFVSSLNNNSSSTNGIVNTAQAVNTAHGVSTASTQVNAAYSINIDNLSDAVICSFFASQPNTFVSCDGLGGYDWSDQAEEGPNYALMGFSSSSFESKSIYLEDIKCLKVEIQLYEIAIREIRKKLEIAQKEKDGIQLNVEKIKNASKSLNKLIECQIVDNCKKGLGYENYNAVPPTYIGNFMPSTPDLSFTSLDEFANKLAVENFKVKSSEEEIKVVRKNNDAPIIEEWVSDDEEESVSQLKIEKKIVKPNIVKKEFVKSKQQEKTARKTIK
nr:ribonuclease H-like domain-containing protein [Tanacetum cinerariifolium]